MKSFFRSLAKRLHVWAGLTFGLLFCLMGLSGSIIVFRSQIEEILRPKWTAHGTVPAGPVVDAAVANTQEKWPDAKVTRIGFPQAPGDPYRLLTVTGKRQAHVFCDSRTGEVLGTFDVPWLNAVVDFHHNLLMAKSGRRLTGIIGMALFLVSLSGLTIWMLRKPGTRDVGVSWGGPWKRVNFELHRTSGVMVSAFLLLISFTGMWMAYPDSFRGAVERLTGSPAAKAPKAKVKDQNLARPFEEYALAAVAARPGSRAVEMRLPTGERGPVTVSLWKAGDFRPEGSGQVSIDPSNARIIAVDDPAAWNFTKRIVQGATPVHYAEWGGLPLRALWSLIGLMPSLLFISGLLVWSGKWLPAKVFVQRPEAAPGLAESLSAQVSGASGRGGMN